MPRVEYEEHTLEGSPEELAGLLDLLRRADVRLPDGFMVLPAAADEIIVCDPAGGRHRRSGDARALTAAIEDVVTSVTGAPFDLSAPLPPPAPGLVALVEAIRPRLPQGFRLDIPDDDPRSVRLTDPDGIQTLRGGSPDAIVRGIEDEVSVSTAEPFELDVEAPGEP